MRADFSEKTKDTLAKRVGLWCSNPDCRMATMGPNSTESAVTNIGVAAHITAASTGGPRYDETIDDDHRSAIANGIWLCQSCAKLIDSDVSYYRLDVLRRWKSEAEKCAADRLNRQIDKSSARKALPEDMEAIPDSGYYVKEMPGYSVKIFVEGDNLHVEHELENGSIGYYILDRKGNVLDHRLPFPMAEYAVEIDPALVLHQTEVKLPGGFIQETILMKWGKRAVLTWNQEHRLTDYHFEKGVRFDNVRKVLVVESPDFQALK
jgi:hypothetical protein